MSRTTVEINQAENKRLELIQSKKLGPEFTSTISSMVSSNMKQEYITKEYEIDINNIQSSSTKNTNSVTQSLTVPIKRNFERLENETNETQKK
ncbi:22264_t:CDS:2 [Rhizophagus irregularis]|nr:22264_t:CDS:2 [Rhizophagus irregularis]